jgi:hypothetical protein
MSVVRATHLVLARGHAQFSADAVALAHVDHGRGGADALAARLGVRVVETNIAADGTVTVTVTGDSFASRASAR